MFTAEYFENLLERIERIRKSDRLFYQKVGDIFSTAFDYNPDSELAFSFDEYIEGKLFFAIHRKSKENQYIKPCEVSLYLTEDEHKGLNDIVELYLDYAKRQAEESIPMFMEDWAYKLDGFWEFDGFDIVVGPEKLFKEKERLYSEKDLYFDYDDLDDDLWDI